MKRKLSMIILVFLTLTFTNCGGGGSTIGNGDYETALYLAYSTTNSTNQMNLCAVQYINLFVDDMAFRLLSYISQCSTAGNCQNTINMSSPPSAFNKPLGVTEGTIYSNLNMSALVVTADLTLSGYKNDRYPNLSYSGKIKLAGSGLTTTYDKLSKMDITISSLTIDCTNLKISQITYTGYKISIDNSSTYPKHTLNGGIIVDDRGYNFAGYTFQSSSTLAMTVSGDVVEGDFTFSVSGSPTADASGIWRSGTVTLGYKENNDDVITTTCTVTLSNTSAGFQITDGDQWDWSDWFNSAVCP